MKRITSIIAAVVLTISLAACGAPPTIAGRWQNERVILEFFNDGTCSTQDRSTNQIRYGNYSTSENRLKIDDGSDIETVNYEIKFNKLIVTNDYGESIEFDKID